MTKRRRSVLIAAANRGIAQGLRSCVEQAGFSVYVAHDGEQAAILAARQRFDLIVTDLDLPVMDGSELCRHVREDLLLTEVPIAVCSAAETDADTEFLAIAYDIVAVLPKPVSPESLAEFVKATIGGKVAVA
jgi:CheY-like chemotaxis protein